MESETINSEAYLKSIQFKVVKYIHLMQHNLKWIELQEQRDLRFIDKESSQLAAGIPYSSFIII